MSKVRKVDHAGVLGAPLEARPTAGGFRHIAQAAAWKLRVAWRRLARAWVPPGTPAAAAAAAASAAESARAQSFPRLLVRAFFTPFGVVNDHLDYKLVLAPPAIAAAPAGSDSAIPTLDSTPAGYWNLV